MARRPSVGIGDLRHARDRQPVADAHEHAAFVAVARRAAAQVVDDRAKSRPDQREGVDRLLPVLVAGIDGAILAVDRQRIFIVVGLIDVVADVAMHPGRVAAADDPLERIVPLRIAAFVADQEVAFRIDQELRHLPLARDFLVIRCGAEPEQQQQRHRRQGDQDEHQRRHEIAAVDRGERRQVGVRARGNGQRHAARHS